MRETDLAWAAGFVDGEGCIQVCTTGRGDRTHALRVNVPQVHRAPLDRLRAMFGGAVNYKGRVKTHHREQWVWEITSYAAAEALARLRPFLFLKGGEADLACQFQWSKRTTQGRATTWEDRAEQSSFREALKLAHHRQEGGDANG